ncbi:amino acid ABC transporter ATP-binding protein [Mesorhizobium sp.]|jgi:polar amino acid transport system ATP-binding protein|uniref:amino acid ABC transporter ATP-binding protein n=1 Tax=Mesorhizobium sp. TaxID=1871066 RepID=UPI003569848A
MTTPIISLQNLSKCYGDHRVLPGINLDIEEGEVVAVIGPSGSGKSTLLRCLNYIEHPTSGVIRVGQTRIEVGRDDSVRRVRELRRNLGMVFQSFNLFPHMTVLRNISLPQVRVLGVSEKEAEQVARKLLERVGLSDKAAQYPAKCSGGQQQRIAIARALALGPKVMLFDEPTSALDPELGLEVLSVMRELAEGGMTMLVVTHEMRFAESVSDRVVIMADGEIIEQGKSADIIRAPQSERGRRFLKAVNDR